MYPIRLSWNLLVTSPRVDVYVYGGVSNFLQQIPFISERREVQVLDFPQKTLEQFNHYVGPGGGRQGREVYSSRSAIISLVWIIHRPSYGPRAKVLQNERFISS